MGMRSPKVGGGDPAAMGLINIAGVLTATLNGLQVGCQGFPG